VSLYTCITPDVQSTCSSLAWTIPQSAEGVLLRTADTVVHHILSLLQDKKRRPGKGQLT